MNKILKFLFLCILLQTGLFAQSNKSDLKKADTVAFQRQLDQITITATRYAENIMEIPYAVSNITNDKYYGKKGYGLEDALSAVPGVLAQSRSGNQDLRLTIRGFGARGAGDRSNAGTSRGIKVMLDGFPETEPDGRTSFDQIDLNITNNIEVIRSNASALWGNASGGVISISSIPSDKNTNVNVMGAAGNYGLLYSNIRANFKIEGGQVFTSFSSGKFDGWRDHSQSSRSILNIGIVSALSEYSTLGVFMSGTSNIFHIPGPLTLAQYNSDAKKANPTYEANDERRFNRLGRIGVTFDHSITESNEISASAYINPKYLQRSERATYRDFNRYHTGGNLIYRNKTSFGDHKNIFSAGADEAYQDGAILFYNLSKPLNSRGSLKDNKREGANNFGAFFQDEINYKELSVLFGGRYDNVTYYNENYIPAVTKSEEKSFTHFTPKLGVSYRLNQLQSIYLNYGGGVEVPAGNETDPSTTAGQDTVYLLNPLLDPIVSSTIEIGTKQIIPFNSGFMKFITLDAALYYIDIKNDIIPYQGGKFYFTAGKTTRKGAELGLTAKTAFDLTLDGALSYSINKYVEYLVDSVHYKKPGKLADYKDNKVAGVPDIFYNATINYAPSFLPGLFINVNLNGTGKYFVDDANTVEVPSYNLINASIGFTEIKITDKFYLKGFFNVNNLTDEKYVSSAFVNPDREKNTNLPMYIEPGLPRNYVFSVSLGIK